MLVCGVPVEASSEGEPQALPPLRQIPGVTAPDQFPRGCVDCHVNRPDLKMDRRISTIMRQWHDKVAPEFLAKVRPFAPVGMALKGRHPKLQVAVADIPKACLKCHAKASKSAPPFAQLLHGLHLGGGEKNPFLSMFQGECTHCHKLDAATGLLSLGGGTEKQ
jgi:hypothetical protein